jgi:hypothetical protein
LAPTLRRGAKLFFFAQEIMFGCFKHILKNKEKHVTRVIDLIRSNKLTLFQLEKNKNNIIKVFFKND